MLESVPGFPLQLQGGTVFDGVDLGLVDGDLAIVEGDLLLVRGPQALGQAMGIALSSLTLDLQMDDAEYAELRAQMDLAGTPRPEVDFGKPGWHDEAVAQVKWEAFHGIPKEENIWFSPDMQGKSIGVRVAQAVEEMRDYLVAIHDVRFDGTNLEIDFEPVGRETHVLRMNGIAGSPVDGRCGWALCVPMAKRDLVGVASVETRLLRHLHAHPELLRDLHWRTFEEVVAELLEKEGWEVHLTRSSKDGGVDIFAVKHHSFGRTLAVVDCKQYAKAIGVGMVRAVAGLRAQHEAELGVLVTTSRFTKPARALEQNELKRKVSLRDFEALKGWLAKYDWKEEGSDLLVPSAGR